MCNMWVSSPEEIGFEFRKSQFAFQNMYTNKTYVHAIAALQTTPPLLQHRQCHRYYSSTKASKSCITICLTVVSQICEIQRYRNRSVSQSRKKERTTASNNRWILLLRFHLREKLKPHSWITMRNVRWNEIYWDRTKKRFPSRKNEKSR